MTKFLPTLRSMFTIRRLALAVAALLVLTVVLAVRGAGHTTISAYFTNSTGLYVGDDVRVLGVKVGKVTAVEPRGDRVLVRMQVDSDQPIPAGANAAIVAPSLVSGRFVQFAPAWTSGPRMRSGAVVDLESTTVPVSFDDVKKELTDLAEALGPGSAGTNGSLSRAITTLNANLKAGNGRQLRASITQLRRAAQTLSDGRSDLFTTVANLNTFTRNIALNDAAVKGFTGQLGDVSTVLDENRRQLTRAVRALSAAFDETRTFLQDDRGVIRDAVRKGNTLSGILADRSNELAGVLHVAPTALDNLRNIVEDNAITARASVANFDSIAQLLCGAVLGVGGTAKQCRGVLAPLVKLLGLDGVAGTYLTSPQSGAGTPAPGPGTGGDQNPGSGLGSVGGLLNGLLNGRNASSKPAQDLLGLGQLLGLTGGS